MTMARLQAAMGINIYARKPLCHYESACFFLSFESLFLEGFQNYDSLYDSHFLCISAL